MAIGDVYRLSAISNTSSGNVLVVNRWAFRQVYTLVLDTPAEDLGETFKNKVASLYMACVATPFTLQTLEVRGLTDPTLGEDVPMSGYVGTLAGEPVGFQLSPIVTWLTGLIGRANRGRTYMPPISEGYQNSGILAAGYITAVTAFANAMITDMAEVDVASASWEMGIWGKGSGSVFSFKPVTNFIARDIMGVQRRRRPGTGA